MRLPLSCNVVCFFAQDKPLGLIRGVFECKVWMLLYVEKAKR